MLALTTLAAGAYYEAPTNYGITVDDNNSYEIYVRYLIPNAYPGDIASLNAILRNQSMLKAEVALKNKTTGIGGYSWTFTVLGSGYASSDGRVTLYSLEKEEGPEGNWEYMGLNGIEVIEKKPYLKWQSRH